MACCACQVQQTRAGSGREIELAPDQICYQILQFLDLVRSATKGPARAQRGCADEVTENQSARCLTYTNTTSPFVSRIDVVRTPGHITRALFSKTHTHSNTRLCFHCKPFSSSIAQLVFSVFLFLQCSTHNSSEFQWCVRESGCRKLWRWDLWWLEIYLLILWAGWVISGGLVLTWATYSCRTTCELKGFSHLLKF